MRKRTRIERKRRLEQVKQKYEVTEHDVEQIEAWGDYVAGLDDTDKALWLRAAHMAGADHLVEAVGREAAETEVMQVASEIADFLLRKYGKANNHRHHGIALMLGLAEACVRATLGYSAAAAVLPSQTAAEPALVQ